MHQGKSNYYFVFQTGLMKYNESCRTTEEVCCSIILIFTGVSSNFNITWEGARFNLYLVNQLFYTNRINFIKKRLKFFKKQLLSLWKYFFAYEKRSQNIIKFLFFCSILAQNSSKNVGTRKNPGSRGNFLSKTLLKKVIETISYNV